ncbi:EpsI family protein [Myxococcota bacterium]|nr:EpsI family protein [Myxococcota bacterium]
MLKLLVALAFLGLNAYVYYAFASEQVFPARESFAAFPLELGDWRCKERDEMEPEILSVLGATDYLSCTYQAADPMSWVNVYVGYHETQVRQEGGGGGETSIHPPAHCLPGSGWDIIAQEKVVLDLPGMPQRPAEVNRLVIARGEVRQLVYYWYQERGRVTADDWKKIIFQSWDRAREQRTDGALVRFTAPIYRKAEEQADDALLDIASRVLPLLPAHVPE